MGQERGSACTIPTEPPLWAGILSLTVFFSCIPVFGTLLPFYVEDVLGESRSWVGVGISSYYIAATLGMAVTGWLSDVIGIRRVIIGACIGNVALLNCVTLVRSIGALIALMALLGFCTTYALALIWVTRVVPGPRLARWLAWAVCLGVASVMLGGFLAGAMTGSQIGLACAITCTPQAVAAVGLLLAKDVPRAALRPPQLATGTNVGASAPGAASASSRAGLKRAMSTRYMLCICFAPLCQGFRIAGVVQTLAPITLKAVHGWEESRVGILYQAGGFGAILGHFFLTPYLSSRPWRHRAVQALSLLIMSLLIVYGLVGDNPDYPVVALVLPLMFFILTALCLGICNFMVALCARAVAPEAVGAITGLTRCLFTLGNSIMPVIVLPLADVGGLRLPCFVIAGAFLLKAILLTWCEKVPGAPS